MGLSYQRRKRVPRFFMSVSFFYKLAAPSCVFSNKEGALAKYSLPREERHHETKPREEKDAAMSVKRVEDGNGTGLAIDRIELGRLPEGSDLESHGGKRVGKKSCRVKSGCKSR